MKIAILKETRSGEKRVSLTPSSVQALVKEGFTLFTETGAGIRSAFSDEAYRQAGATILSRAEAIQQADLVTAINPPTLSEAEELRQGSILVSFIYPVLHPGLAEKLAERQISVIAMESIPRISRAQSMDALSSQSNLAGYKAVLMGADAMGKIFPLMMTAAGTITPSRVLIFGAGVAGLQAVATAKRLGAIVEVTDVRPETKEQVESLGGKFIEVKGEGVQVQGGYASNVSEEYLRLQKEAVNKSLFQADLVITTALVMGKKAPVLITEEQVNQMKMGAVIVDMAVEQGGNCVLSVAGQTVQHNGVNIIGALNLPSELATNASELYAKNIVNLLRHLATKEGFRWELEEEITAGCLITHDGKLLK